MGWREFRLGEKVTGTRMLASMDLGCVTGIVMTACALIYCWGSQVAICHR